MPRCHKLKKKLSINQLLCLSCCKAVSVPLLPFVLELVNFVVIPVISL